MNNLLFDTIIKQGLLLDIFGVIGLGLVALAAIRFAKKCDSTGATVMTWGAISLLIGRIGIMIFAHYVTPLNQGDFDPTMLAICKNVPLTLLTLGLGAIVWGLWGHERQLSGEPITD
ncbi:hypothetical protein [Haloferula sp.]|uniref:hypothetical protein n=1 Tax=Haloferula sp. TaxID=2497595 RepID=UPI00329F86D5